MYQFELNIPSIIAVTLDSTSLIAIRAQLQLEKALDMSFIQRWCKSHINSGLDVFAKRVHSSMICAGEKKGTLLRS